jgi:hypothetical protein
MLLAAQRHHPGIALVDNVQAWDRGYASRWHLLGWVPSQLVGLAQSEVKKTPNSVSVGWT